MKPQGFTPYFFELSGEHNTFPAAEAIALCKSETDGFQVISSGEGYVIIAFKPQHLETICDRIALTKCIGKYEGSCELDNVEQFASNIELPEGTFAIRVKKFGQSMCRVNASELGASIGALVKGSRTVNLKDPDIELRVLLSSGVHFYTSICRIDRTLFEERRVAKRPFFSPISLHPRYARALINLTGVKKGEILLDPFCGTGGILIEAASMGIKVIGSDIDPAMVNGCRQNLQYFSLDGEVEVSDIGEVSNIFPKVSTITTDPPYGRSTSTKHEELDSLYDRTLKALSEMLPPNRAGGVVFPIKCPEEKYSLTISEAHFQRVHKSLTRHYYILMK